MWGDMSTSRVRRYPAIPSTVDPHTWKFLRSTTRVLKPMSRQGKASVQTPTWSPREASTPFKPEDRAVRERLIVRLLKARRDAEGYIIPKFQLTNLWLP